MEEIQSIYTLLQKLPLLYLIFFRTTGLFISAPVINSRNIPVIAKVFLSLYISTIIFLVYFINYSHIPDLNYYYVFLLIKEFLIGVLIGYTAQLIFAAIQLAGQSIDMQMGFGIVNVMDPQSGMQVPLMGTFKYLLAVMIYLAINGHHWLIETLVYSYKISPEFTSSLTGLLIQLTGDMFITAFKLAAPLVGALFITDFVMGIIARTVPQMNVFLVGMPAKILAGLLLLIIIIPVYIYLLTALFERNLKDILEIIKVLA